MRPGFIAPATSVPPASACARPEPCLASSSKANLNKSLFSANPSMAPPLDVYRDWLGINETARPLNYYQLLRLKVFEDNTAKVREHYRKMNAHVRKFATGDYARQSQELLNELAKAMLCLTDAERKREYDAAQGRKDVGEGRRRSLEEILLANKTIDQDQLAKARTYAQAIGLEVRDAVVQQKMASPEAVMLAYAESQGLPYIELEDVGVNEELAAQIPPTLARQHSCVPVMIDQDRLLMASPNPLVPDVEEELRLRFGIPVRTVLCKAASINAAVTKYFGRDAAPVAPVRAAPRMPGKKPAPAKPAKAPKERTHLPDEEKLKRRGMFAFIGFNLGVMLVMVLLIVTRGANQLAMANFLWAVLAGTVAALAGFGLAMVLDR